MENEALARNAPSLFNIVVDVEDNESEDPVKIIDVNELLICHQRI